jgi:hypothetical protein
MAVTTTKDKPFNPFSLDAINFLLADVRGALGPYLNVFLVTQQQWSQSEVGLVTTVAGLLGIAVQTPMAPRSTRPAPSAARSSWRLPCWASAPP